MALLYSFLSSVVIWYWWGRRKYEWNFNVHICLILSCFCSNLCEFLRINEILSSNISPRRCNPMMKRKARSVLVNRINLNIKTQLMKLVVLGCKMRNTNGVFTKKNYKLCKKTKTWKFFSSFLSSSTSNLIRIS